jgi:hypothetical protein
LEILDHEDAATAAVFMGHKTKHDILASVGDEYFFLPCLDASTHWNTTAVMNQPTSHYEGLVHDEGNE